MDQDLPLSTLLASGLAHCQATVEVHGGLVTTLFIAGLVGSIAHCVGMCGPFVLAQAVTRLEAQPAQTMREWHRLAGVALVPYHLGRATTYTALGVVAAAATGGVIAFTGLKWISAALLAAAALLFAGYALNRFGFGPTWLAKGGETWWSTHVGSWARPLFARPVGWRGYALGLALGFLPCGLLYGALAAAAASSDPLAGGMAMLAFSAGTVPALLAVGVAGHIAGRQWQSLAARIMPVLLLLNAGLLTYMAWRTVS